VRHGFHLVRGLAWHLGFNSDTRCFRHLKSLDLVTRTSEDFLSDMRVTEVALQVGIKTESDSTEGDMVRNRRFRSDQIDPSGGIHTTAALDCASQRDFWSAHAEPFIEGFYKV